MKSKRIIAGALAVLLSLCVVKQVQACTIFTSEGKDAVYAACNEDWMYSIGTYMTLTAGGDQGYGRVCFYNSTYVQAGMNEYGLFFDGASCPTSTIPYDAAKEQLGYDLGEVVLASCASVNEAIKLLENCNIPQGFYDHLLFADSSGDSVVLEWMENELHILRKGDQAYQLITNYWLSNPSLGGYPCRRYTAAEEVLKSQEPSVEVFVDILNATKQHWGTGGTLYSGVYNLTNKEVYVFFEGNMNTAYRLQLTEQLGGMKEGAQLTQAIKELSFDTSIETLSMHSDLPTTVPPTEPTISPTESPQDPLPSVEPANTQDVPDAASDSSTAWIWGLCFVLFSLSLILICKSFKVLQKRRR